jgi:hypothetical protein
MTVMRFSSGSSGFAAAHYPDLKDAVFSLLRHSDAMDSMLTEMQESVMMNPPPADSESLSGRRLDGLGPPQLTRSFRALEAHRVAFLREMQELATRFAIQLPEIPQSEIVGKFGGQWAEILELSESKSRPK